MSYPPPSSELPENRPIASPPQSPPYISMLLILLVVLAVFWLVPYFARQVAYSIAQGQEEARAQVAMAELKKVPKDFNPDPLVAKIIEPSVVGIESKTVVASPLSELFPGGQEVAVSQGSGVIVDPAGYILTNAHVVSQASDGRVTVKLSTGRGISGRVIGTDPASDLAVVKIDASGLRAVRWGDSDRLEVGSRVLAVGSPYGLAETVTAGIISAKNREVGIENVGYRNFLQTDAAVNPGNSGGPLVNMEGELVGINTAIVGRVYQGISFAIPSNLARKGYDLLRTTGIARGWLGVVVANVNAKTAERLGLSQPKGALVVRIVPGSPAETAGIQQGDVIVAWNGKPVDNADGLRVEVAKTKPDSKVPVVLERKGKKEDLTVTVTERPNQVIQ